MTAPMIARRSREAIAEEIAREKAKHDRLPRHFEAARGEIMRRIDEVLVEEWLAADG